jgi:hypothetical protein
MPKRGRFWDWPTKNRLCGNQRLWVKRTRGGFNAIGNRWCGNEPCKPSARRCPKHNGFMWEIVELISFACSNTSGYKDAIFSSERHKIAACKPIKERTKRMRKSPACAQPARNLPAQESRVKDLPRLHDRKPRQAFLQVSWSRLEVLPPKNGGVLHKQAVQAWVVRVWEPQPPDRQEPLEWVLLTSHFQKRRADSGLWSGFSQCQW